MCSERQPKVTTNDIQTIPPAPNEYPSHSKEYLRSLIIQSRQTPSPNNTTTSPPSPSSPQKSLLACRHRQAHQTSQTWPGPTPSPDADASADTQASPSARQEQGPTPCEAPPSPHTPYPSQSRVPRSTESRKRGQWYHAHFPHALSPSSQPLLPA